MLTVDAHIEAETFADVVLALEEITRKMEEEYTGGSDRNENGKYTFLVDGQEEAVDMTL